MEETMNPAVFKICGGKGKKSYRNRDAVQKVINYVLRDEGRAEDDLWGSIGTCSKTKEGIIEEFYKIKQLRGKEGGVQLKHLVLSWGKRPGLPRKKMRKLLKQTVGYWGKDYQAVYAVHEDKLPDGYHIHIVLNSVSNRGYKIQITSKELKKFERKFNNIWKPYGYMLEWRKTE